MENCPACNAKYLGRGRCHRCKSDLDTLLKIENQAEECLDKALSAFKKKEYAKMYYFAKKSSSLKRSQKGKSFLFYSAILSQSYQTQP